MLIAQLLLCRFLQSFPPGGLRLSHLPRQLVLPSLQRSGSRRIPATSADGHFRYIAEVLLLQILQKQNETDRLQKKVLYSVFNRNTLLG